MAGNRRGLIFFKGKGKEEGRKKERRKEGRGSQTNERFNVEWFYVVEGGEASERASECKRTRDGGGGGER